MIFVYGVPTCKKIQNTKTLLDNKGYPYTFINVKKSPIPESKLKEIVNKLGIETVINKKGPMFKKLGLKDKNLSDSELFTALLNEQGMITRPLIEYNRKYHTGFDEEKILSFLQD